MSRIDHEKLAALEGEFKEHPAGIELSNFVWLLKCSISHTSQDTYRLIDGLIKLFNDIDINGDKHIEWHEFTQYIIDAVVADVGKSTKNTENPGLEEGAGGSKVLMQEAYSKAIKAYKIKFNLSEKESFRQHICKIIYTPKFNCYIVREDMCDKIKILDKDMIIKTTLDLPTIEGTLFNHMTVTVSDIAMNLSLGFVVYISSDRMSI